MIRLTFLCHGATAATRRAAFPDDEPLEARAFEAAQAMRPLGDASTCLTSPALRASQTAAALGLAPTVEADLRDCDYGRWTGRAIAEVAAQEPEAFAAFMTDPEARPHGGESIADVAVRIGNWLDRELPAASSAASSVVAITHPAVIRCALLHVLSAPLASFWHVDIPPLSTTLLVSDGRRWLWRATRAR